MERRADGVRIGCGSSDVCSSDLTGQLRIGQIGSPPATTALVKGARFRIVGSCERRRALQYFVAWPPLRTWSDLRGDRTSVVYGKSVSVSVDLGGSRII